MKNMIKISILTEPIPYRYYRFRQPIYNLLKKIKRIIFLLPTYKVPQYGGHPSVTRSLIEGFTKLQKNFNYNPKNIKDIGEVVIVLAGVNALKQAITLKKKKVIKNLLSGPNMGILPDEFNDIDHSVIDKTIVAHKGLVRYVVQAYPLPKSCVIFWPAGIDTDYWKPTRRKIKKRIVIYEKINNNLIYVTPPNISEYKDLLSSQGFDLKSIKYGNYTKEQFYSLLNEAEFMIGFTASESQGLFWGEAWSMNVPTLAWKNNISKINGTMVNYSSTCPYLTDKCGVFFEDISNLRLILDKWNTLSKNFEPRKWVLENMSDVVCAEKLYKIIDSLK